MAEFFFSFSFEEEATLRSPARTPCRGQVAHRANVSSLSGATPANPKKSYAMKDFRTIHFKIGEESRPIVENFDHFQHSIFKEQYLNAFSEIETYLARVRSQSKNDNLLNLSN